MNTKVKVGIACSLFLSLTIPNTTKAANRTASQEAGMSSIITSMDKQLALAPLLILFALPTATKAYTSRLQQVLAPQMQKLQKAFPEIAIEDWQVIMHDLLAMQLKALGIILQYIANNIGSVIDNTTSTEELLSNVQKATTTALKEHENAKLVRQTTSFLSEKYSNLDPETLAKMQANLEQCVRTAIEHCVTTLSGELLLLANNMGNITTDATTGNDTNEEEDEEQGSGAWSYQLPSFTQVTTYIKNKVATIISRN